MTMTLFTVTLIQYHNIDGRCSVYCQYNALGVLPLAQWLWNTKSLEFPYDSLLSQMGIDNENHNKHVLSYIINFIISHTHHIQYNTIKRHVLYCIWCVWL